MHIHVYIIHVCVSVYVNTHIHTCLICMKIFSTYLRYKIYPCMYIHIYTVQNHTCVYVYLRKLTYTAVYIYIYMQILYMYFKPIFEYLYIHIFKYIYIRYHIYFIYIYISIYIYRLISS